MAIRKQPDEQSMLFFGGMANAQAAQSMLAWRWNREPNARRLTKKQRVRKEERSERCCNPALIPCTCEEQ